MFTFHSMLSFLISWLFVFKKVNGQKSSGGSPAPTPIVTPGIVPTVAGPIQGYEIGTIAAVLVLAAVIGAVVYRNHLKLLAEAAPEGGAETGGVQEVK